MHVIKDNKQKTYWVTWTGIGQVQHEELTSTDSVAQPRVVVGLLLQPQSVSLLSPLCLRGPPQDQLCLMCMAPNYSGQ